MPSDEARLAQRFERGGWALLGLDVSALGWHLIVSAYAASRGEGDILVDLNIAALHFMGNLCSVLDLVSSLSEFGRCEPVKRKCELRTIETFNSFLFSLFTAYVDAIAVMRAMASKTDGAYTLPVQVQVLFAYMLLISVASFAWCFSVKRAFSGSNAEIREAQAKEATERSGDAEQAPTGARARQRKSSNAHYELRM